MNLKETLLVLAKIASRDNRRMDPDGVNLRDPIEAPILHGWHEDIGDLRYEDCLAAVTMHRKTSTEWLQVAHIRRLVQEIREARLAAIENEADLTDDIDPLDAHACLAALRARRTAIADGATMDEAMRVALPPVAAGALLAARGQLSAEERP